jgi:phage terminase large subunit GpA-like protein
MDAIGDPLVTRVICIKGTQTGWTECLNNAAAFYMVEDPSPILVIQPTISAAESWSKERLAPMIRDTPALTGAVRDPRSRDSGNTILQKLFTGGQLSIIGANAPSALAARPIRIVLADEVDRYPVSAGTEGNPLALAAKRQQTFWNRKTLVGSTPTIKDKSAIEREWKNSDQRRYFVPCPDCGHAQTLRWENVRWEKDGAGEHLPQTAHYMCEACGSLWNDVQRADAVKKGKWIAQRPFNGTAGFHIPGFLSPWLTLAEIVTEFLQARHDPQLLQVWVNTICGETWEEPAESVESSGMLARREAYGASALPDEIRLLTAGVDVQGDRLEVLVLGFGPQEETWIADYQILHGDPAQATVWLELDRILIEPYRTEARRELRIRACCIDTGGHHAHAVFSFCATRRKRRVFPTKGAAGPRPIWPKRASRTKQNHPLFVIGVDTGKDTLYGRLKIANPGPGYIHFPLGDAFGQEFFDQLTAEQVLTRYKFGRPYRIWFLPSGKRNEVLDCWVLALAARMSMPVRLDRLPDLPDLPDPPAPPPHEPEPAPDEIEVEPSREAPASRLPVYRRPASTWFGDRRGGWFDR